MNLNKIIIKMSNTTANVDFHEIAKFDALAKNWWDPQGDFKPLHEINPLRLQFIEKHTDLTQKKIIDVGCGGGILAESMAAKGALVTGIDLAENVIAIAKQHAKSKNLNIDYQQQDVEQLAAQQAEKFDIVTCMELLEHVPDPGRTIAACAKLVKPEGKLFFSTINRNPKAYLFAIIGAEYLLKLLPKGTHDYAKFIQPAEFVEWAQAANLQTQELIGMTYLPFVKKYELTKNIDVNYLIYCEKSA